MDIEAALTRGVAAVADMTAIVAGVADGGDAADTVPTRLVQPPSPPEIPVATTPSMAPEARSSTPAHETTPFPVAPAPLPVASCPLSRALGGMLERAADAGDMSQQPAQELPTYFHGVQRHTPATSVAVYVERVAVRGGASSSALLLAAALVSRASLPGGQRPRFHKMTAHRLWLAAVAVATKFVDDDAPSLRRLASVGGVRADEMMKLEVALLRAVDYRVCLGAPAEVVVAVAVALMCPGSPVALEDLAIEAEVVAAEARLDNTFLCLEQDDLL